MSRPVHRTSRDRVIARALILVSLTTLSPTRTLGQTPGNSWVDGWALPGLNGDVLATTVFDGDLVVGGSFRVLTDQEVNYVARWDGTSWHPIGDGVSRQVEALAVHNGLLVAGDRHCYGCLEVNVWDGSSWSILPQVTTSGGASEVIDMEILNGDLVVSGVFQAQPTTGGTASNVIRWDGTDWYAMGDGLNSRVYDTEVHNGDLVATGLFTMSGSLPVNNVARWDGTQWNAMGGGLETYYGNWLASFGGDLYASGNLRALPPASGWRIAKWDGASWSTFMNLPAPGPVYSSATRLYVAGQIAPSSTPGLHEWDGTNWTEIATSVEYGPTLIGEHAGDIVIAGRDLEGIDGTDVYGIADWDGATWAPVHNQSGWGTDGDVTALQSFGGNLVAAGSFNRAGNTYADYVAFWDGTAWGAPAQPNAPTWRIGAIGVHDGKLVVDTLTGVKTWDGVSWSSIDGLQGDIRAITSWNGSLVVGGSIGASVFTNMPRYVALWNGTDWVQLGAGFEYIDSQYDHVFALGLWNGKLIVGGGFDEVAGISVYGIASWDGSAWAGFANGLPGNSVFAVIEYQGDLVVGVGGTSGLSSVLRWDGAAWQPIGDLSWTVQDLAVMDGQLYATGWLTAPDQKNVAVWDGTQWTDLFGGLDGSATAIEAHDGSIFVGGSFSMAGGKTSDHIAQWDPTPTTDVYDARRRTHVWLGPGQPSPFAEATTLRFSLRVPTSAVASVHDVRGRLVRVLLRRSFPEGVHRVQWDGRNTAGERVGSGVYFVRVQTETGTVARRVVQAR